MERLGRIEGLIELKNGWKLRCSKEIMEFGEEISSLNYNTHDWLNIEVPTSVVNGKIQAGEIKIPYYGTNLKKLEGYKKDVKGQNLESHYKPKNSPYRSSWWYRTEFTLTGQNQNKENSNQYWLWIKGIHYRANIWLNGKRIAGSDYIIGSYRRFFLNITKFVSYDKKNVLALEIFSSEPDELGISFVDWSPLPPDDDMGIWQPIYLCKTGPVIMNQPFISSELSSDLKKTQINIELIVENGTDQPESTIVQAEIEELQISQEIQLLAYERQVIRFNPEKFPKLTLKNPRIWWPYQLGSPEIYNLKLKCFLSQKSGEKKQLTDEHQITFGVRNLDSRINEFGSRVYQINGQDILVRGAGWTCDMMLRHSIEEDKKHIALLKNLNFNTVRLEGKLASDEFWELCDREGILVMAGWCCCSHWEKWDNWKAGDVLVAVESLKSQLLRLRNHPSLICWLYGSDFSPPKPVESQYLEVLKDLTPKLPVLSSASHHKSKLSGDTGVKMTGPYTYVPPIYWYSTGRRGEAKGFNTETGPDVCIPLLESLQRMMPEEQLRLDSEAWTFHAGLGAFKNTSLIEKAVKNRYGSFKNLPEFVELSQILGYEAWRAMFEAYARNFPEGTGVIGWMLNSPWPSLIWQLYDYYFNANGAYYGSKKACEPLHIQYSYDNHTIWIINFTRQEYRSINATVRIFGTQSNLITQKKVESLSLDNYSQKQILNLEELIDFKTLPEIFFLDLSLSSSSAPRIKSKNFYWLTKEPDQLVEKDDWHYTPVKKAVDLTEIRNLLKISLQKEISIERKETSYIIQLKLKNHSERIAFFIWAKIKDADTNKFISPVYWSDNCVSLIPGETYLLNAEVSAENLEGKPEIEISGINIS